MNSLNFLEKSQLKYSLKEARISYEKQHNNVAYEGRKDLQRTLNCVKWPKPQYDDAGELWQVGEGRLKQHIKWLESKETTTDISSLRNLRNIYWSRIDNIIAPMHPYRNKMEAKYGDIDWSKIDKVKISNYSRMQSYIWRSTHGELFTNKHFHAMGIKQESRCELCNDEEPQTF